MAWPPAPLHLPCLHRLTLTLPAENDVQTFFSKFGEIEGIEIPGEKDGRPRGFAFITFTTSEQ